MNPEGGTIRETAGTDFTPHVIPIQEGENIVQRIWSFSHRIPESICILSAAGTISSAEVHNPDSPGSVIRYEGQFSIVYLGGSHTYDDKGSGKIFLLSVQLVNAEGRFCGGAVASSLIASGPTQLIIGTFKENVIRPKLKVMPLSIETPKPNKGTGPVIATAPVQAINELANDGVATDSSTVGNAPPNEVAPLPLDWKSFEQSIGSRSGCGTSSSGLDTGAIN
ncbi:hypothetical protein CASFOL_033464 [Castilleja foliolosa]|uniref:AT-hook motif nuclear-localized protein n=1 Tax=Castilleja foliolosa TaxID=1961234 RepID=A0ABD3C130_9LAMI